jgi:hypothetical protein
LSPGEGGTLECDAPEKPSDGLLAALAASKAELLELLRGIEQWDQAEAERLLAELRHEVNKIRDSFGGRPPAALDGLLNDAIIIGQRYILDRELEAIRGWDSLELLRDLVPYVRDLVARCTQTNAKK